MEMLSILLLFLMSGTGKNTRLQVASNSTAIGNIETIICLSRNGSLPMNYTLFHKETSKGTVTVSEERKATFKITIYNERSLGPYICKADNVVSNSTYSKEFTFTLQKSLTNPELQTESNSTAIGNIETITCFSKNGSLPINYTLFHNKTSKGTVAVTKKSGATFNITIFNETSLGPYKCKAHYGVPNSTYSKEFTFTLQKSLTNPELQTESNSTAIGNIETITCFSKNGSLPINYTLFHNKTSKGTVAVTKKSGATFNITIINETSLGPYKCKADYGVPNSTYSKEFTFTLQRQLYHHHQQHHYLAWLIPILILILVLLLAVILFKLIIKHRKESTGCDKGQEVLYSTVKLEEGSRNTTGRDKGQEVLYSTVELDEGNRDRIEHDEGQEVLYSTVVHKERTRGIQIQDNQ